MGCRPTEVIPMPRIRNPIVPPKNERLGVLALSIAIAALACSSATAFPDAGAVPASDKTKLRICAAANELPFSNRERAGFENKIATVVAEAMGRTAEFVFLDKASIYIVRDLLDKRQCDVVMGLDTGDPRVLTTRPYYRSGYVFVQKADSPLDIKSWESPDLQKVSKVGFIAGTPVETMVRKVGLYENNFNYMKSLMGFKDRRNQYVRVPPEKMVAEVADGTADIAVHFAPDVARYVKADPRVKLTLIPDENTRSDGEKVPHHFDQSAGVRLDDKELLAAVDLALEKAKPAIDKILGDEGIPLLPVTKSSNRGAGIDAILGPDFE
jgi:mxaJ protein